jgi:hypothetical protein
VKEKSQVPNDELKKSNDINGLQRCPHGSDVGIFGKSKDFVDSMTASFVYAEAISELARQTLEVERMSAAIDKATPETDAIQKQIKKTTLELDAKWALAAAMLGIQS